MGVCVSAGAGIGEKAGTAVTKISATAVPLSVAINVRVREKVGGTAMSGLHPTNTSKIIINPRTLVCIVNIMSSFPAYGEYDEVNCC